MIFLTAFFFILYGLMLVVAIIGWCKGLTYWNKTSNLKSQSYCKDNGVSIIIPFRNEGQNLARLLNQPAFLNAQIPFELILVNDHSEDDYLSFLSTDRVDFKLINNIGCGKKSAIYTGVCEATYEFVLTTDADCQLPKNWIESMLHSQQKYGATMVFGGVKLTGVSSFLTYFQQVDYASMVALSGGLSWFGEPFLCSGASLLFNRQIYLNVKSQLRDDIASGDDVFLMHAFKQSGNKIVFCFDSENLVEADSSASWKGLYQQRVRWGSKAVAYSDWMAVSVTLIVFGVNVIIPILFAYSLFVDSSFLMLWCFAFSAKALFDVIYFVSHSAFWKYNVNYAKLFIAAVLYPFWVSFVALTGLMVRSKWKGRS